MSRNFYIADWHYGHANILAYDNRPFRDVDEMNSALIAKWNDAVGKDDTVFILGDMFWKYGDAPKIMDELHGKKVLIRGNHDKLKDPAFVRRFESIHDYLEVYDDEWRNIILCHYPICCFKNHTRNGWYHFYGHVHNSFESRITERDRYVMENLYMQPCRMYNVGAMMPYVGYTPRTADEIIQGYDRLSEAEREAMTTLAPTHDS